MKTEQEQIIEMTNIIKNDYKQWLDITGVFPEGSSYYFECLGGGFDCARLLNKAGYGDVSEYKAEIERLETENDKLRDYAGYLKNQLGQEQAVIVNAIVKYCENPDNWRRLKDCKLFGGKSDDLREIFSEIFVCEEGKPQNIVKMLNAETKELMLSMYSRKMQQAVDEQFLEDAHTAADSVLCELLTLLGYDKVVKIYNTLPKMYS